MHVKSLVGMFTVALGRVVMTGHELLKARWGEPRVRDHEWIWHRRDWTIVAVFDASRRTLTLSRTLNATPK